MRLFFLLLLKIQIKSVENDVWIDCWKEKQLRSSRFFMLNFLQEWKTFLLLPIITIIIKEEWCIVLQQVNCTLWWDLGVHWHFTVVWEEDFNFNWELYNITPQNYIAVNDSSAIYCKNSLNKIYLSNWHFWSLVWFQFRFLSYE